MTSISITPELTVPAPCTGVYLGTGMSGPVALRLLRPAPTRITIFSAGFAAQLLAMRAALAGTRVRVLSDRPDVWGPVVKHGGDARLVDDGSRLLQQPGPSLVVDARSVSARREIADWQCLIDLRSLQTDSRGELIPDIGDLADTGVALFGVLDRGIVAAIQASFGVDPASPALRQELPSRTVALVTRGAAQLVRVE